MCIFCKLTGQLYSETSLRALSSPSSLSRLSALPRLLSLLERQSSLSLQESHSSMAVNSATHSLTLPLLRTVIMSHDASRDLKDVAVRVLCKAVEEFTSSYDEVHAFAADIIWNFDPSLSFCAEAASFVSCFWCVTVALQSHGLWWCNTQGHQDKGGWHYNYTSQRCWTWEWALEDTVSAKNCVCVSAKPNHSVLHLQQYFWNHHFFSHFTEALFWCLHLSGLARPWSCDPHPDVQPAWPVPSVTADGSQGPPPDKSHPPSEQPWATGCYAHR